MSSSEENSIIEEYDSLFHYTNEGGLSGILSSKTLWATHYLFLNDLSELTVFKKAIKKLMVFKEGATEEQKKECYDSIDKLLSKMLDDYKNYSPFYITSFCPLNTKSTEIHHKHEFANGKLSQWRGYARDGGYFIKFVLENLSTLLDPQKIMDALGLEEPREKVFNGIDFLKVGYYFELEGSVGISRSDDKNIESKVLPKLSRILDLSVEFFSTRSENNKDKNKKLLDEAVNLVGECAPRIKDYGFYEENEARLVSTPWGQELIDVHKDKDPQFPSYTPKEPYFRTNDNVPYIKLFGGYPELFIEAIKGIIIGPGEHQPQRKLKVEMLLKKHGYIDVNIRCSDIPLV